MEFLFVTIHAIRKIPTKESKGINRAILKIRKALKEDMPKVLELIQELADFENEPDAVEITVEDLEREGLGENPLFHCLVAEKNGEVVGTALFYFRFSTWKGRSLHLEDLIVKESERGQGIGEALYKEVMRFAYDRGLKRVAWDVLDWNVDAIRFYERTGAKLMSEWRVVHFVDDALRKYIEGA